MNEEAEWAPRPGHQVVVLLNHFILFGGFGLSTDPTDPFKPSNPMDVWVSRDGANWKQVSDSPWNATSPGEIKYDFDALAVKGGKGGLRPSIFTFGGDRETFDFTDPTNYLKVDNDVWRSRHPTGRNHLEGLPVPAGLHPYEVAPERCVCIRCRSSVATALINCGSISLSPAPFNLLIRGNKAGRSGMALT